MVQARCCGPKDPGIWLPRWVWAQLTLLLPACSRLLYLSSHPVLEQWLLQILWGRFCLAYLTAFIIRSFFPLRSPLVQGSPPASLESRSRRGGFCFVSFFLAAGACRYQYRRAPAFPGIEWILSWAQGLGRSTFGGQKRRESLGMMMGCLDGCCQSPSLINKCLDSLERIVWMLLLPSAVWPCGNDLTPQCLVSPSINGDNNSSQGSNETLMVKRSNA